MAAPSCGGDPATTEGVEAIDTVRLQLSFGGGVELTSANYTLDGPGTFHRAGVLTVGTGTTLSATFENLNTGNYHAVVVGTANDDASFCKGDVTFHVDSLMNAVIQIPLVCSGRVTLTADVNTCPLIDSLSAIPSEVVVGASIHLTAETHDPDGGPAPIVGLWSLSSGMLTATSPAGATFTCTAPGTYNVSLKINDGTPGMKCADTVSVSLICTQGGV